MGYLRCLNSAAPDVVVFGVPQQLYGVSVSTGALLWMRYLDEFSVSAFVAVLLALLVAMGTYRSPAVALMPDLTPKPLRSRGNAIINLKGVLDRYDIPFPAIPEVGITGQEVSDADMDDIIPVF